MGAVLMHIYGTWIYSAYPVPIQYIQYCSVGFHQEQRTAECVEHRVELLPSEVEMKLNGF